MSARRPRIAVIGHVEHVTIAAVDALPRPGDILHLDSPQIIPAGGGGMAFAQLARSLGDIHLYTAFGNDDAAGTVEQQVRQTGATINAARRGQPHTRDLVLVTQDAQRTIIVVGEPLHPRTDDPLPWPALEDFDAVYFTGQDPATIVAARKARILVVTARRREALMRSGVRADVVVGSAADPREATTLADYPVPPDALVMTAHDRGGTIYAASSIMRYAAAPVSAPIRGTYGAGDTFAGALTWYLACGLEIVQACQRAAVHAAAILRDINPLAGLLPLE